MKLKVLFVLHLPPPVHGSSMVGQYITDSVLINKEFDTDYINLGTSKSVDEIGKNPAKKVGVYLKIVYKTFKQLLFFKPDIVYLAITAKGIGFYKDVVIAFLAKLFGMPLVLHFHNKGVSENQDRFFDNLFYKTLFRNTTVILLSKYLFYDIKKYVAEADVFYCPNGIPEIKLGTNAMELQNGSAQLLFLSNLIESKGIYILLEAFKILNTRQVSFHCRFVGGIGDVNDEQFKIKVQQLNLESSVAYMGKLFGLDKESEFEKADVFILPTFNDCFPLVLLEAMQFSLPIVSTFEGGIPDVVEDGRTGFLVPQKDAKALADKLEILINDAELRKQMGVSGREKYEKEFTLDTFETKLTSILNAVLN